MLGRARPRPRLSVQEQVADSILTDCTLKLGSSLLCDAPGFDFVSVLQQGMTKLELSWHLSDHYPLWVEFGLERKLVQ